jgi:hypothetical protein
MNLGVTLKIVLIVGSSPDALRAKAWSSAQFSHIVVMNNAWNIRDDWDYIVYPEDFPLERRPKSVGPSQSIIEYTEYVPAQNEFGGVIYIGGTMAFTTAYWALHALKPDILAFVGCDMIYPTNSVTHFYGQGSADPLRDDITLQSLEAKAIRLQAHALEQNCYCINLTSLKESRLVYPVVSEATFFGDDLPTAITQAAKKIDKSYNREKIIAVKAREKALNYLVETGDYWRHLDQLDASKLDQIDQQWLSVVS